MVGLFPTSPWTFLKKQPEESKVGFHMSRGQSSRVFLRWGWSVPGCPALDGHPDVNFKDWETIHQIWLRRRNDLWLEVVDGRAGIGVPAHLSTNLVVWPTWRSFKWNDDPNQPNTMSHLQCLISTKLLVKRRFGCVQSLDSRQTERSMPPTEWLLCGLHGLMPLSGIHIWHLIDCCLFCCEVNWIITTWVNWLESNWISTWVTVRKTGEDPGLGFAPLENKSNTFWSRSTWKSGWKRTHAQKYYHGTAELLWVWQVIWQKIIWEYSLKIPEK